MGSDPGEYPAIFLKILYFLLPNPLVNAVHTFFSRCIFSLKPNSKVVNKALAF